MWKGLREEAEANPSLQRMIDRAYTRSGSHRSVEAYALHVYTLCRWAGKIPEDLLKPTTDWQGTLNDYLVDLVSNQELARATALHRLAALLSCFGFVLW